MGAKKGQNNFRELQARRVESNGRLISHLLSSIRKGLVFKDIDSLIVFVAKETQLHRTTIKRNPQYMRMLLDYFANQPGAVGVVSDEEANAAILRAKLIACKTRVKNLEMELEQQRRRQLARVSGNFGEDENSAYVSFANTAMALFVLLQRLSEKELGIALDSPKKQIIDITELGAKRVIVGSTRTKWFFEWLSLEPTAVECARQLTTVLR